MTCPQAHPEHEQENDARRAESRLRRSPQRQAENFPGRRRQQERRITLDSGVGIDALDVLGLGAALTGHVKDANFDSPGSVFVNSWQDWFDSIWEWLAS